MLIYMCMIRAVNPRRLQILRVDGEGMIGDVIMQGALHHL